MRTLTKTYSVLHTAFGRVAKGEGLRPFDCRVLLAIADAGGAELSDDLERAIGGTNGGSAVRRSLSLLYRSGHAEGVGVGGGRRRPGIRTRVSLTPRGFSAARAISREARI